MNTSTTSRTASRDGIETLSTPAHAARYTRTAMILHWLIAVLIIVNVVLGLSADALPDLLFLNIRAASADKHRIDNQAG